METPTTKIEHVVKIAHPISGTDVWVGYNGVLYHHPEAALESFQLPKVGPPYQYKSLPCGIEGSNMALSQISDSSQGNQSDESTSYSITDILLSLFAGIGIGYTITKALFFALHVLNQ